MICPNCKAEYREGYTVCADCEVPLVEKLEEKSGEGLVRKLSLEDPAIKIRDRISSTLSSEIGWRDMQIESIYSGDDSINALKARFVDGIVLDVRTTFWGLRITEEYEFGYQTRGRLLDLFSSKVIWEGTCSYAELNKDFGNLISWTGDIDLASGEKLKQAAMRAAKYCSEQFIYQITETK